jgi:hypothetical protein
MIDAVKQTAQLILPRPAPPGEKLTEISDSDANHSPATAVSLSRGGRLLAEFPPLILDPATHLKKANEALKQAMVEMGIPENTPIEIEVSSSGRVTVDMDHEKAGELEKALNPEPGEGKPGTAVSELRNSMVGASVASVIGRVAAAASMAQEAADKNPANLEQYYAWAKTKADEAKSMSYRASFNEGAEPAGTLVGIAGDAIGIREGLHLPA